MVEAKGQLRTMRSSWVQFYPLCGDYDLNAFGQ